VKITTLFAALGLVLAGCALAPGTFQGEWIRGDFDTQTALTACKQKAKAQPYPAKCEASPNLWTGYGEVWLINTNSDKTESGNEITKIWVLKKQ